MRNYLYALLRRYLGLFIRPHDSVVEIDPASPLLVASLPGGRVAFRSQPPYPDCPTNRVIGLDDLRASPPDFLVIGGQLQFERDVQTLFTEVHRLCGDDTRLVLTYYNSLWRPLAALASWLGLRTKAGQPNWLAHEDIENLLKLERFELVHRDAKVLLPVPIPVLAPLVNRYIAPLPGFRALCLVNLAIARPLRDSNSAASPSVSIVVPARNEAGNIERIVERIPKMGPEDEIIFVEGHSSDGTWQAILATADLHAATHRIVVAQQDGRGKGDAVRKGFDLARNEILMILDADMTVPPEDLPRFYRAICEDRCEFANGTRLVYPMEDGAMRFFNLLGNKFFATAFSFVLGQRFKDTLCGTKVLRRRHYRKLAASRSYFGNFDPFGDFDLLFGAARMGLKIVEIPIQYRERQYGETNIARWRHGAQLMAMVLFAARRIKFL